jgi:hypothetical protein
MGTKTTITVTCDKCKKVIPVNDNTRVNGSITGRMIGALPYPARFVACGAGCAGAMMIANGSVIMKAQGDLLVAQNVRDEKVKAGNISIGVSGVSVKRPFVQPLAVPTATPVDTETKAPPAPKYVPPAITSEKTIPETLDVPPEIEASKPIPVNANLPKGEQSQPGNQKVFTK